ncbi:MAG: IS5 family transposase [Ignavibacteriaceae bacterium]|nr:IS5 family transposase [Ignavibacteriaceae bacterium]
MKQQTFSDVEYANRRKKTKRDEFLEIMEEIIPWDEWVSYVEPYYPEGKRGRPPMGIEKMLRMYLLQIWFNLSDEGVEDAIYDSYAMRKFMGINFMNEQVPDATTLLNFRHLIEESGLGKAYFAAINRCLEECGHMMKGGTVVDATIINAPSSTKNASKSRDPEMCQTKKGNQWYFGMKCHIGVDAGTGYIHSIEATAANIHDIAEAANLIRPDDEVVYGDAGYLGIEKRPEIVEDKHKSQIDYRINQRPGKVNGFEEGPGRDWLCYMEHQKSSVRAKVEHPFHIIKNTFGFSKVCYRGIAKNLNRLYLLAASANLLMCARSGGWRKQLA